MRFFVSTTYGNPLHRMAFSSLAVSDTCTGTPFRVAPCPTAALNNAIQLFDVQEGRLPKNLQELVPKYVGKIPEAPLGYKLVYDAKKGEVSVVRQ